MRYLAAPSFATRPPQPAVLRLPRRLIPRLLQPSSSLAPCSLPQQQHSQHRCRCCPLFHPPHVVFVCLCFAPLRTCVDAIQHPALGGCSACSGRDTRHSHGRAAVRVVLPNTLSVCACIYVCHPLLQQSGVDAMRNPHDSDSGSMVLSDDSTRAIPLTPLEFAEI